MYYERSRVHSGMVPAQEPTAHIRLDIMEGSANRENQRMLL